MQKYILSIAMLAVTSSLCMAMNESIIYKQQHMPSSEWIKASFLGSSYAMPPKCRAIYSNLIQNTRIADDLGGQKISPLAIALIVKDRIDTYFEKNPMHKAEKLNEAQAKVTAKIITEIILNDHRNAIQELQEAGYIDKDR